MGAQLRGHSFKPGHLEKNTKLKLINISFINDINALLQKFSK